ncbi:hypothetical protein A2U01_0007161 [Trifolium medium]|uniref:Uncharacterized protein n=1 Tax=Trifolium medium TaxID=97028 RepID=A0A392MFM2_9FABA|nr:hypothetical protein [Trifolium medium]
MVEGFGELGGELGHKFPRVFRLAEHPDAKVHSLGEWENNVWCWKLRWRRRFFVWEETLLRELMETIDAAQISLEADA